MLEHLRDPFTKGGDLWPPLCAMWLCGSVAMWLCGYVTAVWLCDYVGAFLGFVRFPQLADAYEGPNPVCFPSDLDAG